MLNVVFPYKIHLHILQLSEYRVGAFLRWVSKNYFKRKLEGKKPLVWTSKAKLIYYLALTFAVTETGLLTITLSLPGLFLGLILATQAYLFLTLTILAIYPFERYKREKIKIEIRSKIDGLKKKGLKIIGITGSFGKTSVKEFLYEILKTKYRVLKTPESYNTLLGIVKVIDYELDETYDFFICEMGAYKIGEIKELCEMVPPGYAILTGINEQHLERFGSIENTIQAKFELVQAVGEGSKVLLNEDNENVVKNYEKFIKDPHFYFVDPVVATLRVASGLIFGQSNLSNLAAATEMAKMLGMSKKEIEESMPKVKPIPHRLEIKELDYGVTLIDDAYSSNVDGFKQALDLLATFKDRPKILVTPGIVELGKKTKEVHLELGKLANEVCDKILLVGKSDRTEALAEGVNNPSKIIRLDAISQLKEVLAKLNLKSPVVLLENDLPDNY